MMACCTTLSPLNSSQKRGASSMFDYPKTTKRRRPFNLGTSITNNVSVCGSASSSSIEKSSTMFTTTSSINRPAVIVEGGQNDSKRSVFQSSIPYMPLSLNNNSDNNNNLNQNSEGQFKSELMERLKLEAKRMAKRKQLNLSVITNNLSIPDTSLNNTKSSNDETNTNFDSESPKSPLNTVSPSSSSSLNNKNKFGKFLTNHNDLPIFSMNQVNQICESMLKEREQLIREEYDKILTQKLNEQYDAFVKFTHEQIQRRFETSQCSYVS